MDNRKNIKLEYKNVYIPLDRGVYQQLDTNFNYDMNRDTMPLGFYQGYNTTQLNGVVRGRPKEHVEVGSYVGANPLVTFSWSNRYYCIGENQPLKYWNPPTAAWVNAPGSPVFTTTQVNVAPFDKDFLIVGAENIKAISVAANSNCVKLNNHVNTYGIVGVDEGRVFVCNPGGSVMYSTRYDKNNGYDITGQGEWFTLGNGFENVISMISLGGRLFIIKSAPIGKFDSMSIWVKVLRLSDSDSYIEESSFKQVYGSQHFCASPKGITQLAGHLFFWLPDIGLVVLNGSSLENVGCPCDNILMVSPDVEHQDNIYLSANERYRLIFCHNTLHNKTFVYDFTNQLWMEWDITPRGSSFGTSSSIYSDNTGIKTLGQYETGLAGSNVINPYLYTPSLDFGEPLAEKTLRRLMIGGKGWNRVRIYLTRRCSEAYHLWFDTDTAPTVLDGSGVLELPNDEAFLTAVIRIDGLDHWVLKYIQASVCIKRRMLIDS